MTHATSRTREVVPRVLMVEGDGSVARMLRYSLSRAGFDVVEAATGREALQMLEQRALDAVILDLDLPNGLEEVIDQLHESGQQGESLPVWVVISTLNYAEVTRRYGSAGSHFLAKPFNPWDLITTLKALLSARDEPPQE